MTTSAAESDYVAISTPVLKIAESDNKKFESLQSRALEIIHGKQP